MKNILITGGNFDNQGAYMMLVAAANGIRDHIDGQPVLDVRWGTERQKRWEGLDTLISIDEFGPARSLGFNLLPKRVRDRSPALSYKDIDGVLDVSGFAFGDQWSHARLTARAKRFTFFARRGKNVVLMPQAFGPFVKTAEAARIVLNAADLVYARDPESARHLQALTNSEAQRDDQICLRPDFTVGLTSRKPAGFAADLSDGLIIVPNANIALRGSREDYINVLLASIKYGQMNGLQSVGLVHDSGRDRELFAELASRGAEITTIDGLNGLEAKWVLGRARAVVSGRFHASVSALSCGVPVVIHGWSHKYNYLASDFGVTELLASPYSVDETTRRLDSIGSRTFSEGLGKRKNELIASTVEMWNEIAGVFRR